MVDVNERPGAAVLTGNGELPRIQPRRHSQIALGLQQIFPNKWAWVAAATVVTAVVAGLGVEYAASKIAPVKGEFTDAKNDHGQYRPCTDITAPGLVDSFRRIRAKNYGDYKLATSVHCHRVVNITVSNNEVIGFRESNARAYLINGTSNYTFTAPEKPKAKTNVRINFGQQAPKVSS